MATAVLNIILYHNTIENISEQNNTKAVMQYPSRTIKCLYNIIIMCVSGNGMPQVGKKFLAYNCPQRTRALCHEHYKPVGS